MKSVKRRVAPFPGMVYTVCMNEYLEEKLAAYAGSGAYPMHMPGHKRAGKMSGRSADEALREAMSMDITEIEGFDDLHAPSGILLTEMDRASAFYGTKETYFSVCGSTAALLAAVSAAIPHASTLLMARSAHQCVYHAAYLRGLTCAYLRPEDTEDAGRLAGGGPVREAAVREGLRLHPEAKAVLITSPTYDGVVSDVRAIAEAVHEAGALLIVDEAHGAHFSRHPYFPRSAIDCGADLVVQSMHKTLPALTGAALLHNVTGRADASRIRFFLDVYETSSPSYLILSSMTACLHGMMEKGEAYFDTYAERLSAFRKAAASLPGIRLLGKETAGLAEGEDLDPGKLCIDALKAGISGPRLAEILRRGWRIEPELNTERYVLAMTSPADTEEGFARLLGALAAVSREGGTSDAGPASETRTYRKLLSALPETAMTLTEAVDAPDTEDVPVKSAEGRIAAAFVSCFPPEIPLLVPGEVIPEGFADMLEAFAEQGICVRGAKNTIRCIGK